MPFHWSSAPWVGAGRDLIVEHNTPFHWSSDPWLSPRRDLSIEPNAPFHWSSHPWSGACRQLQLTLMPKGAGSFPPDRHAGQLVTMLLMDRRFYFLRPGGSEEISRGCREARPESPDQIQTRKRPGRDERIGQIPAGLCPALSLPPLPGRCLLLDLPGVPSFLGHPRLTSFDPPGHPTHGSVPVGT